MSDETWQRRVYLSVLRLLNRWTIVSNSDEIENHRECPVQKCKRSYIYICVSVCVCGLIIFSIFFLYRLTLIEHRGNPERVDARVRFQSICSSKSVSFIIVGIKENKHSLNNRRYYQGDVNGKGIIIKYIFIRFLF